MSWCNGCGGLVGRDCFNPQECEWITQQMNNDAAADVDQLKAQLCELEKQREADLKRIEELRELLNRSLEYVEGAYECAFPDQEKNTDLSDEIKQALNL